ncbi:MAG: hypothetical protein J0M29_13525 [Chitinophagales bacterium]|nr:hypothetical protein [Chitinophagales bacterium]
MSKQFRQVTGITLTQFKAEHRWYGRKTLDAQVAPTANLADVEASRTFLETYKPILLVFSYILGATLLVEAAAGAFDWMRRMRHFMVGFFLGFSLSKCLMFRLLLFHTEVSMS